MERNQGGDELHQEPERGEVLKINAIVIPANDEEPLRQDQIDTGRLADYQERVGGPIQVINLDDPPASLYLNEEGKLVELPVNRRATLLLWGHHRGLRYEDIIVGDAFLVGVPDRRGRDTNVPDEFIKMLLHARRFRTEVQTYGDPQWYGNRLSFENWAEAYGYVLSLGRRWTLVENVRVVAEE